jgi:hypothetical protein
MIKMLISGMIYRATFEPEACNPDLVTGLKTPGWFL